MADQKRVTIQHKDGREYSILPADFTNSKVSPDRQSYAEQGFRIVGYVDGTPYEGPATQRQIEQAAAARQEARDATQASGADGKTKRTGA